MRSSTILALVGGTLAAASPMLDKKAYKYEWVTDIVWVTVTITEGQVPAATAAASTTIDGSTVIISSTVVVAPVPNYSALTTTAAPVVVTTTETPALAPTSTEASIVIPIIPTTSSEAPVVLSTTSTEAPVVVPTTSTETPVVVETPTSSAAPVVVPTSSTAPVIAPTTSAASVSSAAAVSVQAVTSTPVASSTTAAAAASSPTDFDSTCVFHHNVHRTNHSAPAVTYDSTLAGYAKTLSDSCSNAHDVTIGGGGYGQNIASYGSSSAASFAIETMISAVITNMWYDGEAALYDDFYGQDNPTTNFDAWGHFSQVVWKSTTTVGCAATLCAPGTIFDDLSTWFAVCNYQTAGNVAGEYADNVLPPTEGGSTAIFVDL